MALFLSPPSASLDTGSHRVFHMAAGKKTTFYPFLFTQSHSFRAKHYTTNPSRNSCLHLTEKTIRICSQMPVLAPSGSTIKNMWSVSVFLKNLYNGFQGGHLIWSVFLLKRYNKIPSVLREDNGLPKNNSLIGRRDALTSLLGIF